MWKYRHWVSIDLSFCYCVLRLIMTLSIYSCGTFHILKLINWTTKFLSKGELLIIHWVCAYLPGFGLRLAPWLARVPLGTLIWLLPWYAAVLNDRCPPERSQRYLFWLLLVVSVLFSSFRLSSAARDSPKISYPVIGVKPVPVLQVPVGRGRSYAKHWW